MPGPTAPLAMLVAPLLLAGVAAGVAIAAEDEPIYPANGEELLVQAVDNSFIDEQITIEAGTTVVWLNRGRNDHNIIPEDGDLTWTFEDVDFEPTEEVSFVFQRPGTYRYYCSIHGNLTFGMPGVVVVTEPT